MIGIDTNVLVRYLTQDDARQARVVDSFLSDAVDKGTRLHIDDIVLCELVWVLRGAYRFSKATIVSTLDKIMSTGSFSFDDRELLRKALHDYRDGDGDFADHVIGHRNIKAGCEQTVTFDRSLAGSASFNLLTDAPGKAIVFAVPIAGRRP
jgi:predicted nucleic-acid-binding protein